MLGKVYLLAYNCVVAFGWSWVLWMTIEELHATKSSVGVYDKVKVALKVSQTMALLEVLHAAVGLVRSSPFTTFTQVQSRLVVLWLVLEPVEAVQGEWNVPMMICTWCIAEITRYCYYALALVDKVPYLLTWARYSFFTFLYPIGISGELLTMYSILPHAAATGMFSYSLPNALNVSFSFSSFLVLYMLAYIPVFPKLYGYMLSQRRKVLGKLASDQQKKSS